MFVLEVDLEEECPFDPCRLGMPEICNMAREYMRGPGIEMLATKCSMVYRSLSMLPENEHVKDTPSCTWLYHFYIYTYGMSEC
jgi:hypothetical protein